MTGMSRERGARGFTLIELLVVVAIIALLISILLPSLAGAREQARAVQCLSNLRSMGGGILDYTEDHLGTLPGPLHSPVYRRTGGGDSWNPCDPNTQRPWFLLYRIAPMFGRDDELLKYIDKVATCPTAAQKFPETGFRPNQGGNPSWSKPFNYLINSYTNTEPKQYFGWVNIGVTWTGWQNFYMNDPNNMSYQPPKKLDKVKKAAEEWAVGDAWWAFKRVMLTPGHFRDTMLGTWQIPNAGNPTNTSANPLPKTPYHRNARGTNLLYFDGHGAVFNGTDEWARKFPANRDPNAPLD